MMHVFISALLGIAIFSSWNIPITNACEQIPTINATIYNLTHKVNFKLHDRTNLSNYDVRVTYSWDVSVPEGDKLDGFIHCLEDVDEVSVSHLNEDNADYFIFPGQPDVSSNESGLYDDISYDYFGRGGWLSGGDLLIPEVPEESECRDHLGMEYWVTDLNGTYTNCTIPCEEQLGSECTIHLSSVCLLSNNCKALPRDDRSVTLPIRFGRRLKFTIRPYVGLTTVEEKDDNKIDQEHIFCAHHLIEEENITSSVAYEFCETEQSISNLSVSSGPPTDLHIYNITDNLEDQTATAIFRWKAPHDIAGGRRITFYLVNKEAIGEASSTSVRSKSAEEEELNPYYNITVTGLLHNKTYVFRVTPYVTQKNCTGEECTKINCASGIECEPFGTTEEYVFNIPVFSACVVTANHTNYCDPVATCIESGLRGVPGNCTCPPGYGGNGIAAELNAGDGCTSFNACMSRGVTEKVCDPNAICVDDDPPSMGATCYCPSDYAGDGKISGSGCTEKKFIVAVGVGVPLAIIFVSAAFFVIWRYRLYKRRELDRKLSKFVAGKSSTYTAPLVLGNNNVITNHEQELRQTSPVFGAKLELDRSRISRQGVIGRGNFGVVHKAILSRGDIEETVAVKALSGAYTSNHREDFLAEIALLLTLDKHDNVLGVVGVCTTQPRDGSDDSLSPLLVTEYMQYGDLLHFLWDSRDAAKRSADPIYDFSEISLYNIGRQVARGMHFLSQSRVIHGDVAARNILIGQNLQCKISDFGLANDVYRYGLVKAATERRVPFKWVSPERMMGGRVPITWRSDVWSFGILLYEMVTLGAAPYPAMDPVTIFYRLRGGYRIPQPQSCSDYLYEIMKECWKWDAIERPKFNYIEKKLAAPLQNRDNENDQSLSVQIRAQEQLDQSRYDQEIGRRDSSTFPAIENGHVQCNGKSLPTNGHATNVEERANHVGNGTLSSSIDRSDNADPPCVLWSGDIAVQLDSKEETSNDVSNASCNSECTDV